MKLTTSILLVPARSRKVSNFILLLNRVRVIFLEQLIGQNMEIFSISSKSMGSKFEISKVKRVNWPSIKETPMKVI